MKLFWLGSLCLACTLAAAQEPTTPAGEPQVQRIVVQDDQVRVEEERVRGVTRKLVVKPKDAAAYEVAPTNAARDPSQPTRGNEGRRAWNVFKF
jgi:hypothetical protein